jgi:vesicle-associated membrane protein 7
MPTEEGDDEEGAGPSSSVSDNSKVQRVRNEVDRVKDIVIASLDSVMERGERLELLVDKTDELTRHSVQFKQRTVTLRRRMWWQNKKMMLIVFLVAIISIYIIVSISCGGLAWPKCV